MLGLKLNHVSKSDPCYVHDINKVGVFDNSSNFFSTFSPYKVVSVILRTRCMRVCCLFCFDFIVFGGGGGGSGLGVNVLCMIKCSWEMT